jgi:Flp pilus assembly protein protease CpaA
MAMSDWFKSNASTVWPWVALIAGALVIFWASRGTQFQQFGLALLVASVALLLAMTLFEVVWLGLTRWFSDQSEEKSAV